MTRKNSYAKSSTSAVKRVRQGGYAYLTDGPVLQYKHQRKPCNTFLLKNLLMAKGYGLGLPLNSEWTQLLSVRILKVRWEYLKLVIFSFRLVIFSFRLIIQFHC